MTTVPEENFVVDVRSLSGHTFALRISDGVKLWSLKKMIELEYMWHDGTERSVDSILVNGSPVSKINLLSLGEAGICGACSVMAIFGQSKIVTSHVASSAAVLSGGKITMAFGYTSRLLENQYFIDMVVSQNALAALTRRGKVITWGDPHAGGDISRHKALLDSAEACQLCSSEDSFAALLTTGQVVAWGRRVVGGTNANDGLVQGLHDAKVLIGAGSGFCAIRADGTPFVWGYNYDANDPVDSADLLSLGIRMNCADIIQTTGGSALNFAILLRDGKLITFDASTYSISDIMHRDNMRTCFNPLVESGSGTTAVACNAAFGIALQQARLRPRLLLWGEYPDVEDNENFFSVYGMVILDNVRVKSVVTNTGAACALLEDRTIHVFGTSFHGACCTSLMRRELYDIVFVATSWDSFAAIRRDGQIFCWGRGDADFLFIDNIATVDTIADFAGSAFGFVALHSNGNVSKWHVMGQQFQLVEHPLQR